MHKTTIEDDVRAVVAAETAAPQITPLDPARPTRLGEIGFDVDQFLSRLGLQAEEPRNLTRVTLAELVALIESKSDDVRDKLAALATAGRVRRLLQGMLLSTLVQPPVSENKRWWYGLARQILWWYARQDSDTGLQRVQRGIPDRALESLAGLGLLEIDLLSKDEASNAATFIDVLERLEYPADVATDVYRAIVAVAKNISERYDGQLPNALRRHGNEMVDALAAELLAGSRDPDHLANAVRSWVSTTTQLPIAVWSPSTTGFVRKFAELGVSEEMLIQVASDLGLGLLMADTSLADFMEGLCRNCDPRADEHQYCVRRFAAMNWQVECPANPSNRP